MNDYSYLMKGIVPLATGSSILVSCSPYLDDPRLPARVPTHMLRRNGSDVPAPSSSIELVLIPRQVQDIDHTDALIGGAREVDMSEASASWC